MADALAGGEMPKKSDYLMDTIDIGLMVGAEALIPVFVWFLYETDRPGMDKLHKGSNDWYYISWWVMWIGHLVAFAFPFVMWIPAYFNGKAAELYGMSWSWAHGFGAFVTIFVWTTLFISGI